MTKPSKARADADGGWKDIIEDFPEAFFTGAAASRPSACTGSQATSGDFQAISR